MSDLRKQLKASVALDRLTVVPKPRKLDRSPHKPKVSPFAPDRDAFSGAHKGLVLRVLAFGMASATVPRRGS